MRWRLVFLAALGGLGATANAPAAVQAEHAENGGSLAERAARIDDILTRMPVARVVSRRQFCATGIQGEMIAAVDRAAGAAAPYELADECLAYFTRAAREGRMEPVAGSRAPAAQALDGGFMAGFQRGDAITAELPGMAALKPIAERCLAQQEPNTRLCSAAGYALGVRAAHGEVVTAG